MARLLAAALLGLSLVAASCGGGDGPAGGESPRERFAAALDATRHAGSAALTERMVSQPADYDMEITGRTRFDYNDALLTVKHMRHPQLAPNTQFHVRIANYPYVRRTDGSWYAPPYHTGEFELGFANFMHLVSRAYGRVEEQGPRTLLVRMSPANLERLRTSREGSLGPLGTLHDLQGPIRFELDEKGRIVRFSYTVTGRYYFSLTPLHRVTVTAEFRDFEERFDVEAPPEDDVTPGPLIPPQPAARADSSRL